MKKSFLLVILFFLSFTSSIIQSQTDTIRKKIDSLANIYLSNPYNAGLMIGIYRERTDPNIPVPPEFYSYGEIIKGEGRLPDTLTFFKLGSVGKTFTASALAYYIVNYPDSVNLNDIINKYFPTGRRLPFWDTLTSPGDTIRISLLDLATHYSALPDQPHNWRPPPHYLVDTLLNFLGSNDTAYHVRPLPYEPGTKWLYSNTGFGTLGVVLENLSGKSYDSLLRKIIFDSLRMPDSKIFLNSQDTMRLAYGYDSSGIPVRYKETSPGFYGAGGNFSTMSDMIKYLAWNMGFKNSSLNNLLDTLHKPRREAFGIQNDSQGLAWQMGYLRENLPKRFIWKDGGTTGFSSYVCWVSETKTGVVVLSNSSIGVDNLGKEILRVLNPLQNVGITNTSTEIPQNFSLKQNYPNPFNPVTIIKFDIPSERNGNTNYKLLVYDALGKEISTLVNEQLNPGSYEVEFNGENLSSGVYYYKLFSDNFSEIRRMVLLK